MRSLLTNRARTAKILLRIKSLFTRLNLWLVRMSTTIMMRNLKSARVQPTVTSSMPSRLERCDTSASLPLLSTCGKRPNRSDQSFSSRQRQKISEESNRRKATRRLWTTSCARLWAQASFSWSKCWSSFHIWKSVLKSTATWYSSWLSWTSCSASSRIC